MSSTGTMTSSSICLALAGCTTVTGRAPPRNVATSAAGRTVADSPIRCARPAAPRSASSRSSDSARCAPRLVPATACTSSTMTVSTPRSVSRACEVSSRNSDSGVVMRMSGGCVGELAPLVGRGVTGPHRHRDLRLRQPQPPRRLPDPGQRRPQVPLDVHRQRLQRRHVEHPAAPLRSAGGGAAASRSIAHRNAASVLPDPVGAMTSVSSPFADGPPGLRLRLRGHGEGALEPRPRRGREPVERRPRCSPARHPLSLSEAAFSPPASPSPPVCLHPPTFQSQDPEH